MQFGLIEINSIFALQLFNITVLLGFFIIILILLIKQFKMYGQISRIEKMLLKKYDSPDTAKEL